MFSVRLSLAFASLVSVASAAQFASTVVSYNAGTVTTQTNAQAALGKPEPIVGGFGIYSFFNPHYETSQITGFGVGGSYSLAFPSPINLIDGREIGVFTNVGVNDPNYPSGTTGPVAQSFSTAFAGVRRTALVTVTSLTGQSFSLGRVLFDNPVNYFSSGDDAYAINGDGLSEADFGKPFLGTISSFDNTTYAQTHAILNGSAGGDWLDVPAASGLANIASVSFSAPQFLLANGTFADSYTSPSSGAVTNASLFLVGLSANNAAVPEPMMLGCVGVGAVLLVRRRNA